MEYRFTSHGKEHGLSLKGNREDGFEVSYDDRTFVVRPLSSGDNRLVLDVDGRRLTLFVADSRDQVYVAFEGRQYVLNKTDGAAQFSAEKGGFGGAEDVISTPMPGRLVKVLVAEEDVVEPDQPVFIIESMKMENEVRALAGGRVKKVFVAAGDSLNHGDAVLELEPLEQEAAG